MAQINWELIRKRMLIYKYQPGYFTGGVVDPCANWILYTTFWRDSAEWSDTCVWQD